jgi:hypothetical protein
VTPLRRALRTVGLAATVAWVAVLAGAVAASAQEVDPRADEGVVGAVQLSFVIGAFDVGLGDFPVTAVTVLDRGGSEAATTVELRGAGGRVLWSATVALTPPSTTIPVDPPVAVGAVESAGVARAAPVVAAEQFVPPEVFHSAQGGGGSGQLALSLVLVVALVAIVFRTPLPSATTQRWTR